MREVDYEKKRGFFINEDDCVTDKDETIVELLRKYKEVRTKARRELRSLLAGNLRVSNKAKKTYYAQDAIENKKRIRKGISKDTTLIYKLARKRYLKIYIKLITQNILALELFLQTTKPPTPDNVWRALPDAYKHLPHKAFFPKEYRGKMWGKEEYDKSTYRSQELRHTTARGEKVRSKSEALIANLLHRHKLPYRYEQKLHIKNREFVPDFTILVEEDIYYWEHCGLVSEEGYMKSHNWKLLRYAEQGIVPWKNLIVTYDDENGNFNGKIAEGEIINKLLR